MHGAVSNMWRLFVSLYLLIAIFLPVYDEFTDYLVDNYFQEVLNEDTFKDISGWLTTFDYLGEHSDTREWAPFLEKVSSESNFPVSFLSVESQADLYPQSIDSFDDHRVFYIDVDDYEILYKLKKSRGVLHIGPLATSDELINIAWLIEILSFLFLAIVIFIWHLLLWRKLVGLESMADKFGAGNMEARVSEKYYARVGNLNQSFNKMADQISQLISQNKQLLHAVSHELRSPISRLRCVVDLVETSVSKPKQQNYINDMSEDITELENLVDEILNYSYLESLNHNIQRRSLSLDKLLGNSLSKWKRETGTDIRLHCDEDMFAEIDSVLFLRAVGNLVTNASRYCTSVVEISIEKPNNQNTIVLHVDDDGPGIKHKEREGIFEPFARTDFSRARETGGYGLGLAIVHQIVKQHRGEIVISTSPLGGARFTLTIPVSM